MIQLAQKTFHERTYDFHGIVQIRVRAAQARVIRHFDAELGRFRVESTRSPDIDVTVAPFKVLPDQPPRITEHNHATNDIVYGAERHKVARWQYAIRGLNDHPTEIFVDGGPFSMGYLYHRYIEQVLRYKLIQHGHVLVHGCCLARDGVAVMLPGLMHTGKTTIALHLARRGWAFQSDDYVLLDASGRTHSYPRRLHFSSHIAERYPDALATLKPRHVISMAIKKIIHQMTFGYGSLSEAVAIEDVAPGVEIAPTARLGHVILLATSEGNQIEGPFPLSYSQAVERILAINWWEGNHFWKLLLESVCMNVQIPRAGWPEQQRAIIENGLQHTTCYELVVPRRPPDTRALLHEIGGIVEKIAGKGVETPANLSREVGGSLQLDNT